MTNNLRGLIAGDRITPPMGRPTEIREYYRKGDEDRLVLAGDDEYSYDKALGFYVTPGGGPLRTLIPPTSLPRLLVSAELRDRFDQLIASPDELWSRIMPKLMPQVQALGHTLWIVGGAVRDLILGKEPSEVNDLDLAGTTPPALFKRILTGILASDPLLAGWHLTVSGGDVVHIAAGPTKTDGRSVFPSFFQHLTLRRRYDREYTRWYSGSDPLADLQFRDIGFNALFYCCVGSDDVQEGSIMAPDAEALRDFDLSSLETWHSDVDLAQRVGKLRIRPLAMPAYDEIENDWGIKGISRVVKAIHKFPRADTKAVGPWLARYQPHFERDFVRNRELKLSAEAVLAGYLERADVPQRLSLIERLARADFPNDVLDSIEAALGVRSTRVHLGAADPVLRGWGLRRLTPFDGGLAVGEQLLPGLDPTPDFLDDLLLPVIGEDVERTERPVTIWSETYDAYVLESAAGSFVVLDDLGRPWRVGYEPEPEST